ncbi:MAG TPA: hypothetical protein VHO69_18120 [Phototrophicaceae bacterium]|nr:hypothetical protein [Phototrophicaceae bacterium]
MKSLPQAALTKAVTYLQQTARPLERALYAYHFTGAPAATVLTELAAFQNADGGFHGLEPDIRLKDSSVIATTIAFQRFREIHAPADHPLIVKACRYLLDTYEAARLNWPIIPPNVDDAPHAPWWTPGDDLEKSLSNPRAEIAGYVNEYAGYFPAEMRQSLTQSVLDTLFSQGDALEMHDLLCYLRFYETVQLPDHLRGPLLEKLKHIVNNTVARDPEQWKNYGLPPLAVISAPESPFAPAFRDEIEPNLDFLVTNQDDDGTWKPNWSWGGLWPEAWEQAERDWTGVITLENLRKLRAFGRLV